MHIALKLPEICLLVYKKFHSCGRFSNSLPARLNHGLHEIKLYILHCIRTTIVKAIRFFFLYHEKTNCINNKKLDCFAPSILTLTPSSNHASESLK